ncbi:hypothetical protein FUA48_17220 [Flavobacterium alkalisoli]|uniref:TonB C-terminal domain-containing protein n=1 Tax=Flavobacterium alkalisoli TaxID=2602769 RepID=A0A5B9FXW7_9FLAO|nr:hypothetical protein [Flavobacterium alkalisoli]QEE51239.1 hypothetical protein FUA48_17220 [Flavobacterium alkalisoli]
MKVNLYLVLLFALALSCSTGKGTQETIQVYNPNDFLAKQTSKNNFKVIDTFCINETERAERDIKKGKLVLHDTYIDFHNTYEVKSYFFGVPRKGVIEELSKFNIVIDTISIPDLYALYGEASNSFRSNCYQEVMKTEVENLLEGHSLSIDTLVKRAERQFVIDNPDKVYCLPDRDRSLDESNEYENFITKSRVYYTENFIYPEGYHPQKEELKSYTTADFILMKDGSIENLTVKATFQNAENLKYKSYFENGLRKFVLKTKWIHPKYSGIVRNSEMHFNIYFK